MNWNWWIDFADILYRNLSYGLLWKNWGLQSGKNLAMPILDPFWSKFVPFWPKINILACLISDSLSLDDFLYRNYSYGLLLENWGLQSGKNLAPPILGPFWSKFGLFGVQHIFKTCLWLGTWSEYSNYTFSESFMEQLCNDVIF